MVAEGYIVATVDFGVLPEGYRQFGKCAGHAQLVALEVHLAVLLAERDRVALGVLDERQSP